jgi:hypothetical protein
MNEEELYFRARKRVKARRKLYSHILSWVIMSAFFILLNLFTSNYFWAIFPILGWGIGVAFHGIQVFSEEWEDKEVDKEYERMRRRHMHRHGEEDEENLELHEFKDLKNEWKEKDFV